MAAFEDRPRVGPGSEPYQDALLRPPDFFDVMCLKVIPKLLFNNLRRNQQSHFTKPGCLSLCGRIDNLDIIGTLEKVERHRV
jgi:hypothetical protein